MDPKITPEQYLLIINPMIANYARSANRPFIVIPSAGTSWEDVAKLAAMNGLSEDKAVKLMRIIEPIKEVYEELPSFVVAWEPSTPEKDFELLVNLENSLMESAGHPPLRLVGVERITHYHGLEGTLTLANLDVTRTRKLGSMTIWLSREIFPELVKRLRPLASTNLKLIERNGSAFLYGIKPRTDFYFVEPDESRGYLVPKLTPVK